MERPPVFQSQLSHFTTESRSSNATQVREYLFRKRYLLRFVKIAIVVIQRFRPMISLVSSTSLAVLTLHNALGVPSSRFPIDCATFVSFVLPPLVCYFIAAILTITPQTRTVRLALWPIVTLLALRAALSVDMSLGKTAQASLNLPFVSFMLSIAIRTLDWASAKEPLVRHVRPANSFRSTIIDALDLVSNERGLGWEWSGGLYVARETRPANRMPFVFWTFVSAVTHALICGAFQRAFRTLVPVGVGPIPDGSTIFDETLPFFLRYLRASIISTFAAFTIYAALQMYYDIGTIPAILVLRQDPAQWPPLFDAPWRSTSLSDFWGRRWHQLFRRTFLVSGGYPLSFVLGRSGIVIGSFLASAILHHIEMITLNSQMESWWMFVGFGVMAPGILAERAFYRMTGRRVGGVVGWVWTMTWLVLWGNVIVEGFARAGMFRTAGFIDSVLPVQISVGHWVEDFDAWLHTI